MSYEFRQSLHALRPGTPNVVLVAFSIVLVCAWFAWFALGSLVVTISSESSRIEVVGATSTVVAPADGRLLGFELALGSQVVEGQVLASLDVREAQLELEESDAQRASITSVLASIDQQIAAEKLALEGFRREAAASSNEARAYAQAAQVDARSATQEAERARSLFVANIISRGEYDRLVDAATRQEANHRALVHGISRSVSSASTGAGDRSARIAELLTRREQLEGDRATIDAARERLELRIERRVIKSPIAGSIGTLAGKKTGSLVQKGEVLVTIVPTAELQVVALLPVSTALGRVEVGQHARLRLDGFPWTQFGSLTATVARVGQESQDGMLRVELDADHASLRRLPLRHGLTGNLDIEVEQLRPIDLVLRKLAQHLGRDPA